MADLSMSIKVGVIFHYKPGTVLAQFKSQQLVVIVL